MVRTCPFCKSHLSLSDRFFCSICGNILPTELIYEDVRKSKAIEVISTIVPEKATSSDAKVLAGVSKKLTVFKNRKLLPIIFGGLLIPVLTLFLFDKLFKRINIINIPIISQSNNVKESSLSETTKVNKPVEPATPVAQENNKYKINPLCTFISADLFNSELIKYIPFDADFYLETQDSKNFVKEIIDSEIITDPKFISFYEKNKESFVGPTGFFVIKKQTGYEYGIVSGAKNLTGKPEDLEEFNVKIINNFVAITTDSGVLAEISDAEAELSKNLGLNPVYASAKLVLPKSGKLTILPLTKIGKGFAFQLLDKKLTENISSIINAFLDSKLDYAVVL